MDTRSYPEIALDHEVPKRLLSRGIKLGEVEVAWHDESRGLLKARARDLHDNMNIYRWVFQAPALHE